MGLTEFQRYVCRLIAETRKMTGESYVAGGSALNEILACPRVSRDVDLFHDSRESLQVSWHLDREALLKAGCQIVVVREYASFVEVAVTRDRNEVILQWTQDSAYRFFPLIEHPDFGLTLHPIDLATNKVLALVGRVEVRDWIDTITIDGALQPIGYVVWAACGKDPGLTPGFLLEQMRRSCRYTQTEVSVLDFEGGPPDAATLSEQWRTILSNAERTMAVLPAERIGCCVLDKAKGALRASPEELTVLLEEDAVLFHMGAIRGVWPQIR